VAWRANALTAAGALGRVRGDIANALRMLEESAALARASGDDHLTAGAMIELGTITYGAYGDIEQGEALWSEALELYRRVGDRLGVDRCLHNLGEVARARGDYQQALAYYEASLPVVKELGDQIGLGTVLVNLGATTRTLGDLERAMDFYCEALQITREINWLEGQVFTLNGFAGIALDRGRPERTGRLLGAAAALAEAVGLVLDHVDQALVDQDMAAARTHLGEAGFAAAYAAGRNVPLETALTEASLEAEAGSATEGHSPSTYGLTERELEVLRLLVAGRTDREIAGALFIGLRTAQGHVANIMAKFGVTSRTAAATAAIAAGIVAASPGPST
jgi:non-specific serine/threonine protein kinase